MLDNIEESNTILREINHLKLVKGHQGIFVEKGEGPSQWKMGKQRIANKIS